MSTEKDSGMPESFSVLIHELRGLCLDTQLLGGEPKRAKGGEPNLLAPEPLPESDNSVVSDDLLSGSLNLN
ncbi:MAG: hypothetical protein IKO64_05105 [Kiritimatiellae bacterium]|nr:hypothetical protein [Kiritimatiellia bacterium]